MLGAVTILKEPVVQVARPVLHLRLVSMPKVTYIGELYKTPKQQHPQERSLAEVIGVEGLSEQSENGVYAIKVNSENTPQRVFLSEAQKITSQLPKKDSSFPTYGRDEVTMEPHPIREGTALHKAVVREYRKSSPDTSFDFV